MKVLLLTVLLLSCAAIAGAQAPVVDEKPPAAPEVAVDSVFLAKDDGEGQAGEEAESFMTTDVPIYCVVQLTSNAPVTVRMNLVAVSVPGVKAETRVVTVSYKTNGRQDRVNFTGRPDKLWTAGKYRVDIFLDDKLATNHLFQIVKPTTAQSTAMPAASDFVAPKPKPRRPPRKQR